MNAKEARAKAEINRKNTEEQIKLKKQEFRDRNIALLYNAFCEKIDIAVNLGLLSTSVEFNNDRFTDEVMSEAVNQLQKDGFGVKTTKHNAYQKIQFELSWVTE